MECLSIKFRLDDPFFIVFGKLCSNTCYQRNNDCLACYSFSMLICMYNILIESEYDFMLLFGKKTLLVLVYKNNILRIFIYQYFKVK